MEKSREILAADTSVEHEGSASFDGARGTYDERPPNNTVPAKWTKLALDALRCMRALECADAFNEPVPTAVYSLFANVNYYDVISDPMDFGTVEHNLQSGVYRRYNDCVSDIQKVFRNCRMFNLPGSTLLADADECEAAWIRLFRERRLPVRETSTPVADERSVRRPVPRREAHSLISLPHSRMQDNAVPTAALQDGWTLAPGRCGAAGTSSHEAAGPGAHATAPAATHTSMPRLLRAAATACMLAGHAHTLSPRGGVEKQKPRIRLKVKVQSRGGITPNCNTAVNSNRADDTGAFAWPDAAAAGCAGAERRKHTGSYAVAASGGGVDGSALGSRSVHLGPQDGATWAGTQHGIVHGLEPQSAPSLAHAYAACHACGGQTVQGSATPGDGGSPGDGGTVEAWPQGLAPLHNHWDHAACALPQRVAAPASKAEQAAGAGAGAALMRGDAALCEVSPKPRIRLKRRSAAPAQEIALPAPAQPAAWGRSPSNEANSEDGDDNDFSNESVMLDKWKAEEEQVAGTSGANAAHASQKRFQSHATSAASFRIRFEGGGPNARVALRAADGRARVQDAPAQRSESGRLVRTGQKHARPMPVCAT